MKHSMTRTGFPPRPADELAEEIIENLEAGLNSFREVLAGLNKVSGCEVEPADYPLVPRELS